MYQAAGVRHLAGVAKRGCVAGGVEYVTPGIKAGAGLCRPGGVAGGDY